MSSLLAIKNLEFGWNVETPLLRIASFSVSPGEHVFMKGPSGSGKSTLLGLISGVLNANTGSILFDGTEFTGCSAAKRDEIRANQMGVIFQLFNLLPYLDLVSNVALPCRFSKPRQKRAIKSSGSVEAEARRLLARLGLTDEKLLTSKVGNLSVGQQQRVAAARALIGRPKLIIADEPTSALDFAMRDAFLTLLMEEANAAGAALLFVSHDTSLGNHFQTRVDLIDINALAKEPGLT